MAKLGSKTDTRGGVGGRGKVQAEVLSWKEGQSDGSKGGKCGGEGVRAVRVKTKGAKGTN